MSNKATLSTDWLAGCAGCHMSFLDMDERLVALLEHVSLDASPITDFKHPPTRGVDVGVLEGCVNNSATEATARQMRARCKVLVALGDCAVFGGLPTLRNGCSVRAALRRAYVETESTAEGHVPADKELATMQDARALDQVVPVDVYLPGCPPSPDAIFHVLSELAAGRKPHLNGKYLDWH